MKEIWKKVRGFEEYAEVSNLGQIHRFERVYYCGRNHQIKRIQEEDWTYGSETPKGYLQATIGGVNKGVHVWVYETFNDCDVPKGYDVNHLDENKHNNRLDNLNLMTRKENNNWGTHNAKLSAALRGRKLSPETIEKRAASRRGKHYPKISTALKGRKRPDISAALRGKPKSPEHVAKIAAAKRGKPNPKVAAARSKAVQALDPKTLEVVMEFPSTREAQRQGYVSGSVSRCCRGEQKFHKGLIWRFIENKSV